MQERIRGNRWHPELCINIHEVRPLWKAGLSTRQIGEILGCSGQQIHKVCKKYNLIRTQQEAAVLRQPSTSNHWRSARCAARAAMQRHLGRKLKSWEHVHHKDEDYTNRDLSNLEVLINEDHYDLHWPDRKIPYEQRPHRKEYKRKYNAK